MGWEGRGLSSATVHVGNSRSRATDTQRMEVLDSIVLQLQLLLSNHSRPRHHIHVNEGAGKGKVQTDQACWAERDSREGATHKVNAQGNHCKGLGAA